MMKIWDTILDSQVGNLHLAPGLLPLKNPIDAAGIFMTRFHPPTSEQKKSNGTRPWQITRFGKVMFNNRRLNSNRGERNIPLADSTSCLCFSNSFHIGTFLGMFQGSVLILLIKQMILILVRIGWGFWTLQLQYIHLEQNLPSNQIQCVGVSYRWVGGGPNHLKMIHLK